MVLRYVADEVTQYAEDIQVAGGSKKRPHVLHAGCPLMCVK